jgi:hypothetical protein
MQGQQFSLTPTDDGWFSLRLLLFGFLPVWIASIAALRLTVRMINGRRILGLDQYGLQVPFGVEYTSTPIPLEWTESSGEYHLKTKDKLPPFNSLRLTIEEGVPTLRTIARKVGRMSMVLQPITDTEATILGFGRTGGVTVELINQNGVRTLGMLGMEFTKS